MTSEYRHPKHDSIVQRLREGLTDKAIAAELHVDRRAAARVRGILDIAPGTNSTTAGDKLDRFTQDLGNGHTGWTGRRGRSGTPLIRQQGREIPAAAVAFERRTGRTPAGSCKSDCDLPHCLTPEHVLDDMERRTVRLQLRRVYGWAEPWDECPEGHPWAAEGRVEPDLTLYCRACSTNRSRRNRNYRED